ncbi:MAG TPA: hypothetical protein PLD18_04355 [Flavobacterium sp.]|nr:hypothetical protein [Flavobacterium sp.]HRA73583.1 hypothetical protein [Flavobacterium sp.]
MRKLILILLLSIAMNAQNNGIYKPNSEIVNAEASIIIPIGNLSNKFDYAQSYGFWFKIGEDNGFAANVGFNALFLKNARPIDYEFNDSIYSIDSNKFGFDIGIRAIKVIPISKNQKNYLEFGLTIGIDYLDYDFPSEETNNENDKEKYDPYKNASILLAPEIKYMYDNIGLKFQYRYTPYGFNEEFESKFGSSSISFGIVYKQ